MMGQSAGITRMKIRSLILAAFCCAVALSAAADHSREVAGVSMPEMIDVAGKELRLNGMGLYNLQGVRRGTLPRRPDAGWTGSD